MFTANPFDTAGALRQTCERTKSVHEVWFSTRLVHNLQRETLDKNAVKLQQRVGVCEHKDQETAQ